MRERHEMRFFMDNYRHLGLKIASKAIHNGDMFLAAEGAENPARRARLIVGDIGTARVTSTVRGWRLKGIFFTL